MSSTANFGVGPLATDRPDLGHVAPQFAVCYGTARFRGFYGARRRLSARTYRVTVNDYLVLGGDGFTALTHGTKPQVGIYDNEALFAYFRANSPISPAVPKRITRIN